MFQELQTLKKRKKITNIIVSLVKSFRKIQLREDRKKLISGMKPIFQRERRAIDLKWDQPPIRIKYYLNLSQMESIATSFNKITVDFCANECMKSKYQNYLTPNELKCFSQCRKSSVSPPSSPLLKGQTRQKVLKMMPFDQ